MTDAIWAGLVLACGVLSGAGVEVVRRAALRHDVMDVPNARSSHVRPTPRGGGLAIVVAVAVAWIVAAVFEPATRAVGFPLAALLVVCVSALDDVVSLRTGPRFAAQGVAAVVLVASVGAWPVISLPFVGSASVGFVGAVLAVIWIVGLTNAYNFMDGVDGIAGTQAVVAGAGWAVIGVGIGSPLVASVGAFVSAASVGFLAHNWPPARIFMGDVGAAGLGFVFAALPLVGASALAPDLASRLPFVGLLVVWPFVFDAVFTVARRARRGENVLQAHRSHLYQRLAGAGWSHRAVTQLYGALAMLCSVAGAVWMRSPLSIGSSGGVVAALSCVPMILWFAVGRVEHRVVDRPSSVKSTRESQETATTRLS